MATIKFLIQSDKDSAPIYLRLSLGRNKVYKRKTGLNWNCNKWNSKKGKPIGSTEDVKLLNKNLRDLKSKVLDDYDRDYSKGALIDGNWLLNSINNKFDRGESAELDYLIGFSKYFIEQLDYKVTKGRRGVKDSTKKKYKTILNKLISYEKHKKTRFLVKDVDLKFRADFIKFLSKNERLGNNTIGRYLKFVKTICLDANRNDIKVSNQLEHFQGFVEKAPKVVLSFEELEKIKNTKLLNEKHIIARDWLMIGAYTGQRISDLMRMNKSFIENIQNFKFIVLNQVKTGKRVQIPIHYEVQEILNKRNGDFPPVYAKSEDSHKTLFNRYLKELCEKAEINSIVEGNLYDKEKKKYVRGSYEKYKVIASHVCRRSFATNFYGNKNYPTPILMNITAHSTEEMFLEYIGKKPIDYSIQLAETWARESLKANSNKTELKLLKNNQAV